MPDYRLYCLDAANKISRADVIHAEADEEAIEAARKLKLGVRCEIWRGPRLVASIPAHDSATPG